MPNEENQTEKFVAFDDVMPLTPRRPETTMTIDVDAPHWSILSAFAVFFFTFLSMVVMTGIATGIYIAVNGAPLKAESLLQNPNLVAVSIAAIAPAHLLTLLLAWLIVTRRGKQPFLQTLGWHWTPTWNLTVSVFAALALFGGGIALVSLFGEPDNDMVRMLKSSNLVIYMTALVAVLTAPLVEEVVFRGVMYPALRKRLGAAMSVMLVALIFTGVHVPQYIDSDKISQLSTYGTITVIFLLSLFLTLVRANSKSLLPCFVIHTVFNGIQAILLVVSTFLEKPAAPDAEAATGFIRLFFS